MPEVIFNGPEGRLEGRYHHSKEINAPVALLLHPHPQHGGTMNNRLVYILYQAFVKRGFSALHLSPTFHYCKQRFLLFRYLQIDDC